MATDARSAERPDPDERPDAAPTEGYELIDAGDGRRLERFGARVVDRPAPTASAGRQGTYLTWRGTDLRFDPGTGWFGDTEALEPWTVSIDGLTLELRPTASGGLGLYPEHAANLAWVAARVRERAAAVAAGETGVGAAGAPGPPQVLNLFAHTGLLTLAAARAGAAVAHVDASKGAIDWAHRNASLAGLVDRPIRWLVDDALGFVGREARRGRRYDGIILDPPSFGRAGRRQWKLADELPALLAGCRLVAADGAFVLLTAHTTGLDGSELRDALREAFGGGKSVQVERLTIQAASGAVLELGWSARRSG